MYIDQVRRILKRSVMLKHQAESKTSNYVADLIGCSAPQVKYIERELDVLLDKEDGPKKASWATKDEFKHRRGMQDIYPIVLSGWVSHSPELRPNHGCS